MKFSAINNVLCITASAVKNAGIESNTLKRGLIRFRQDEETKSWAHIVDQYDRRKRHIIVDTIPSASKAKLEAKYGDLHLAYHKELIEDIVADNISPDDIAYLYQVGVHEDKVLDLAYLAAWMRVLNSDWYYETGKTLPVFTNSVRKKMIRKGVALLRPVLIEKTVLKVSVQELITKVFRFRKNGIKAIIHGNTGNDAKKVKDRAAMREWFIAQYSESRKFTVRDIYKVFLEVRHEYGWGLVSERLFYNFKKETRALWMQHRDGRVIAKTRLQNTIKRRRPKVDAMWSVDGTTLQLYSADKKGKAIKELYMVLVTDTATDTILGVSVSYTETSDAVLAALRNAISFSGHLPKMIQYDGGSANLAQKTQETIEKLNVIGIRSQPYNGQSKYVERINGLLEQKHFRYFSNFVGGNITAKSSRTRINPDALKKIVKDGKLPSRYQVINQLQAAVIVFNNTAPGESKQSRLEAYKSATNARRVADEMIVVSAFWLTRKRSIQYTQSGIIMMTGKTKLNYVVESEMGIESNDFINEHLGDSFDIKYNPQDLTHIYLYQKGKMIARANTKHAYHAVPFEAKKGEHKLLVKAVKTRKEGADKNYDEMVRIRSRNRIDASYELVHKDALNRVESEQEREILQEGGLDLDMIYDDQDQGTFAGGKVDTLTGEIIDEAEIPAYLEEVDIEALMRKPSSERF